MTGCGNALMRPLMWPEELLRSPKLLLFLRIAIIPLILFFYFTAVHHFEYTPDDTYIYLQYSRNLAEGNGFAFNQNEPSYGVAGPLWVLLIAAGAFGGLDPYIVAKTLDLVFASLSLLVFLRVSAMVLQDVLLALATTAMFCLDAWFLRWAGSGMETSLAVLLVLMTFHYIYRGEYVISSLTAGLLTLVRPEGGLLFLLILADNLINTRDFRPAIRSMMKSAGVYATVLLPWLIYASMTFGTIVPNTLGAKSIQGFSLGTTVFIAGSQAKILLLSQGLPLAFLIIGVAGVIRRTSWRLAWIESFPVTWVLLLPLFYLLSNVPVISRDLLLISPFIIMLGVWGVKKSTEFWKLQWRTSVAILSSLVILTGVQNQILYYWKIVPHINGFVAGMNTCLKPIAYKLKEMARPDDIVLTPDIGLLGYISGKTFYDTAGLVTPAMKAAFKGTSYEEGMETKRYQAVVDPDFIIDRSSKPQRLSSANLEPAMTRQFQSPDIPEDREIYYTLYKKVE